MSGETFLKMAYVYLVGFIDLLDCLKEHEDYLHGYAAGDAPPLALSPKWQLSNMCFTGMLGCQGASLSSTYGELYGAFEIL